MKLNAKQNLMMKASHRIQILSKWRSSGLGHKLRLMGALAMLAVSGAQADVLVVGNGGSYASIQDAVDNAEAGDTIQVLPGTYLGNVKIDKPLTLESTEGRTVTTIEGVNLLSSIGAVQVLNGVNGVTIGGVGKGFTIIGIDNGLPGIENAALYFQGAQSDVQVIDNEIVANGDSALISEYGKTISNWLIDGNIFSGTTFIGTPAGTDGGAQQFTLANVPRHLVVIGNGSGDLASATATNITFTNNLIVGVSGGMNGAVEQGNELVTLDVAYSIISGNTFAGTTTRAGTALRVRRPNTEISDNTFVSTGMGKGTSLLLVQNQDVEIEDLIAANQFDKGVYRVGGNVVYTSVQGGVKDAPAETVVRVLPGTYAGNVTINTSSLTLESTDGREVTTIIGNNAGTELGAVQVANGVNNLIIGGTAKGFTIVGLDGPFGLEKAAIYFDGTYSDVMIRGNEIVANGDHGLIAAYGSVIQNWIISGNIFSGKTYSGDVPGGEGFIEQFITDNAPRQLVVLGNGGGDAASAKATQITFIGNQITGIAGGHNGDGNEQGNTLVTLDVANSTIANNRFAGTTNRYGAALRVRRPNTVINNNTFDSTGLGSEAKHVELANNTDPVELIAANNKFDKGVFAAGGNAIGLTVQLAVAAAPGGVNLHVLSGAYAEDVNTMGKAIHLVIASNDTGTVTFDSLTMDDNDSLEFQINGTGVGRTYDQLVVDSLTLGGAELVVGGTRVAAANNSFTLIDNNSEDAIGGIFAGLEEGSGVALNGRVMRLSYVGGSGNDVVLYMEPPIVLEDPESQLVFAGDSAVFTVVAKSTDPLFYQWLKDKVEIPGAESPTLEIEAVTLADAGKYTCRVSNSVGSKVTAAAALGVISQVSHNVQIDEGKNLTLTFDPPALPGGVKLAYLWKRNGEILTNGSITATGQSISGAATKRLVYKKILPDDAGDYSCEVALIGQSTRLAAVFNVTVNGLPVISSAGPFEWGVGLPVSFQVVASNGPAQFSASQLPNGLSINSSTGLISGRPTRASKGTATFKVTATNAAGKSQPAEFAYSVVALDEDVSGVFYGLVERKEELGQAGLGGLVKLTVTQTGSFSGTLNFGIKSHTFRGQLDSLAPGGNASASVQITRPAQAALTFEFILDAEEASLEGTLSADSESVNVIGYRQLGDASAHDGLYTAALELDEALIGNADYPQGNGFTSVKVTGRTGATKYTGNMADGTKVTLSSSVLVGGRLPIFGTLYSRTDSSVAGSVHGWAQFDAEDLDGELTWNKGANSSLVAPRTYRAGFPVHDLALVGGLYTPPASGDIILGIEAGTNNARLVFSEGGLEGAEQVEDGVLVQALTLAPPASVTLSKDLTVNPARVTLSQLRDKTGAFNGNFTLKDSVGEASVTTRKPKFTGLLVPRLSKGVGYFILDGLTSEAGYVPQLSGQVLLEANEVLPE